MIPYTQDAVGYLQKLSAAIARDPASMEHWQCLHLTAPNTYCGVPNADTITVMIHDMLHDADGDIVFCDDHDVLLITRHIATDTLHALAENLHRAMQGDHFSTPPCYQLFDLLSDWRDFLAASMEKVCAIQQYQQRQKNDVEDASALSAQQMRNLTHVFMATRDVRDQRMKPQVLLVEDDPITRRVATNVLKAQYAVITASTAQEAITQYLTHAPDIVFLDIQLPDHSGFDVLRQLKAYDPDAYVVMFSGNSYLENVTEALNHGAKGFVAKPFCKEKLHHYVQQCRMTAPVTIQQAAQ